MQLFAERGFDEVSVAENTVYNYFPAKADLFFDEASDILAELLAAVRYRAPGASALTAVETFMAGRAEWAAGRRPAQLTGRFRQLIANSTALQTHQRLMFGRFETALASLLAEETGAPAGSAEPFVASVALIAVLRAPFEASPSPQPGRDLVTSALDLLAGGLAGYAPASRPLEQPDSPGADLEGGPAGHAVVAGYRVWGGASCR
jgi:AcrR family transcriptional regulator